MPLHITKNWIKAFVINHNLCPFAALPYEEDRIKYVLVESDDIEVLVERTFEECLLLKKTDAKEIETTLIVHPYLLNDFEEYLAILDQMQDDLEKLGLEGIVQLASFHPNYQFADTNLHDAGNFTNRSPFPMIHILREDSVEKAIDSHPNTETIPLENIKTMEAIGFDELSKKRNEIIGKN